MMKTMCGWWLQVNCSFTLSKFYLLRSFRFLFFILLIVFHPCSNIICCLSYWMSFRDVFTTFDVFVLFMLKLFLELSVVFQVLVFVFSMSFPYFFFFLLELYSLISSKIFDSFLWISLIKHLWSLRILWFLQDFAW